MATPPSTDESWVLEPVRNTPKHFFFRMGLALILGFFIWKLKLDYVESYLYDLRVALRPQTEQALHTAAILIDPNTVAEHRGLPSAEDHAKVLSLLNSARPKAVVYVFNPKDLEGTDSQKRQFVGETRKFEQFYFVTNDLEMKGEEGKLRLPPPYESIRVFPGPKNTDTTIFAKDGVTRRMMLSYQEQILLHPYLAQQFNREIVDLTKVRGHFEFLDSLQTYINFMPKGRVPTFSFSQIESGQLDTSQFTDKIIFIGQDLGTSTKDYITTPYSRDIVAMTTTEMHANMVETLIKNNAPIRAPDWLNLVFTLLISLITVHVVLTLRPLRGLIILGASLLVFTVFSYFSFWPFGVWISMAHPFLAIFLCYYFFIPYRLIIENRRSWEYYQKHRLLQQVEELKTNFIGMMSHDLKTPLARIQGMTEIILKDETPISSPQREAIDTIQQSSRDLLNFINTILNYARIESQGIELNLQSKDINELLKEVVKKHEFLAKLKHIQINLELEPLFSMPVDADLLKQVFSNLVENAIKYSPENSKVLISSEEVNEKIVIQVADQGIGIPSDELSNIFMKFFRSKNAKSSPIKGSGLGLYLAKYFVELHNGSIFVESTPGQGSTFTVELPIKMETRR